MGDCTTRHHSAAYDGDWRWTLALPAGFVMLWSTGFIGARLGLPWIEPMTFLALRMALATLLLCGVALLTRAPWPRGTTAVAHTAIAGLLVHGCYLGGVFWAIDRGQAAGVTAILVALQPLLTATLVGPVLGERVSRGQWFGLLLGFVGVGLVIASRLDGGTATGETLTATLVALLGITLGTLYQKRFCPATDLRTGGTIQYAAAGLVLGGLALTLESNRIVWTGELIFALAWLVLVLSVGAIGLLFVLIRHGAASRVAALFYLAPPLTVIAAWLLFDERLGVGALLGLGIVVAGVALVQRAHPVADP
jgi:drug/metabolite transporter (DMT)-like permease